ncbi:MAG: hypothetical protein LRZ92_00975 [Methanosarcinaceae archaeon]|jgi:uncharacterized membrane protein YgaE (UPF0421/DUF939 family)|nr:hypothetical protein [Methanosarcinaceae archaeon]NKQ39417.1 hypothetical protein [Methanosarcinales archaeon]
MNLDFIIGIVTIIGIIYIIYRDGIKDKIEIENRFAKIEEKLINYAKNYEKQETKLIIIKIENQLNSLENKQIYYDIVESFMSDGIKKIQRRIKNERFII